MYILQKPDPILSQPSLPILDFDSEKLQATIDLLFSVMKQANGAGLAAVQIGLLEQILVYGFEHNPRYPNEDPIPDTYMINPKVLWFSDEKDEFEEGCLSVDKQRFNIVRPVALEIEYYDITGAKFTKRVKGFEARVIQHELDHLAGITILERKNI